MGPCPITTNGIEWAHSWWVSCRPRPLYGPSDRKGDSLATAAAPSGPHPTSPPAAPPSPSLCCRRRCRRAMSPPRRHWGLRITRWHCRCMAVVFVQRCMAVALCLRMAVVFVLRCVVVVFAWRCVVSVVFMRHRTTVVFVRRCVAVIWVVSSSCSVGRLSSLCGIVWARGGRLHVLGGCCRVAIVFVSPSGLLSGQWWGWRQVK
jgi:hypothetical protein